MGILGSLAGTSATLLASQRGPVARPLTIFDFYVSDLRSKSEPSKVMPREDQSELPMSSSGERRQAERPAEFEGKGRGRRDSAAFDSWPALRPRLAWLSRVVGHAGQGGQGHAVCQAATRSSF